MPYPSRAVRARNLEQRITSLSETAQRMRGDRIRQLREALKIAKAITDYQLYGGG